MRITLILRHLNWKTNKVITRYILNEEEKKKLRNGKLGVKKTQRREIGKNKNFNTVSIKNTNQNYDYRFNTEKNKKSDENQKNNNRSSKIKSGIKIQPK